MRIRVKDMALQKITRFPVEAGHVMLFARAIGDPNPIYHDAAYARSSEFGCNIAPPTFTEAGLHYDDSFPFRPRIGTAWFGSGRDACSVPDKAEDADGTDMHAETHIEYHLPLRVGDVLHGVASRGRSWEKSGKRSGKLTFHETITEFRNEDGLLMVTSKTVGVTTERKVEQAAAEARKLVTAPDVQAKWPAAYPVSAPRAGELKVGDQRSSVVVDNLRRVQIIQYAGASGDFSPQHTDEVYNTVSQGYPSVFAHGMLNMAMMGRMLTDWLGDGKLTRFGARFVTQSWPGDTVTVTGTVTALREEHGQALVDLDLVSTNQYGQAIINGYATACLER
jgi:acyl dehydratase